MLAPRRAAVVLMLLFAFAAASCGGSKSSSTATSSNTGNTTTSQKVRFAKTKFVLHAGLAFGAFHRYIYKPLRSGTLKGSGTGHKVAVVTKAGLAGLFAYHELKIAAADARGDPTLSKLVAPIDALTARLRSLGTDLEQGRVDRAAIQQAAGQVSTVGAQSAQAGARVRDINPPASLQPSG